MPIRGAGKKSQFVLLIQAREKKAMFHGEKRSRMYQRFIGIIASAFEIKDIYEILLKCMKLFHFKGNCCEAVGKEHDPSSQRAHPLAKRRCSVCRQEIY